MYMYLHRNKTIRNSNIQFLSLSLYKTYGRSEDTLIDRRQEDCSTPNDSDCLYCFSGRVYKHNTYVLEVFLCVCGVLLIE